MGGAMVVGLIGVGTVGGTLKKWFEEKTSHVIKCLDPQKGMNDSLRDCDAIFISVPVPPTLEGQDLTNLREAVSIAKKITQNVFVRSTVLPGTCDSLGVISMPEFLTERRAYEDMCKYPVLVGSSNLLLITELFPNKNLIMVKNVEAELAKFTHNCFGALKVTYFNMIYNIAKSVGADFESVKEAASITGFIEPTHTQVPGPDGHFGYGGKCFPENVEAMKGFLHNKHPERAFFQIINLLNLEYRTQEHSMSIDRLNEVQT